MKEQRGKRAWRRVRRVAEDSHTMDDEKRHVSDRRAVDGESVDDGRETGVHEAGGNETGDARETDVAHETGEKNEPSVVTPKKASNPTAWNEEEVASFLTTLDKHSEHFSPYILDRATKDVEKLRERAQAGSGYTVVALVGGTGSGKSSLFNKIVGWNFAQVGDIRPTSMEVSACVWDEGAKEVLRTMGISTRNTVIADTILRTVDYDVNHTILLDLPDHDSIAFENSLLVDSILPQVDVLVWVFDPQKYADDLIHSSYIENMKTRKNRMVAVLNQIDTLPESSVDLVAEDVHKLLVADGIGDIPVLKVSALTEEGLPQLWEYLESAGRKEDSASVTATLELKDIKRGVGHAYSQPAQDISADYVQQISEELYDAAGVPAVAEALVEGGSASKVLPKPQPPAISVTTALRSAWVVKAGRGMPDSWVKGVDDAIPSPEILRRETGKALAKVDIPRVSDTGSFAVLLIFACVTCVLWALPFFVSLQMQWLFWMVGCAMLLCGGLWARALRVRARRTARVAYIQSARDAVNHVVTENLLVPVQKIQGDYMNVRHELLGDKSYPQDGEVSALSTD